MLRCWLRSGCGIIHQKRDGKEGEEAHKAMLR